ncbi:MAG: class I SAM-dependent methyltransferase [Syntrophobacterales bacterium]|nr:class I SAM-dependent methyltransferase [Syntrophobacterales bacterium]
MRSHIEAPAAAPAKAKLVQRYFSAIARRYDLANDVLSFGLQRAWKRQAVRCLQLAPGDWVADLCGGTGDLALLAAPRVAPHGRVLLYDFTREMLLLGREKMAAASLAHLIYPIQGDVLRLALPDGSLNGVIVGFGVRNLTDMAQGFREMHRVLKRGGRLVCLEFSHPTPAWFARLYELYSRFLIPAAGRIIAGHAAAYTYLTTSIRAFPTAPELAALLTGLGFTQVSWLPLTRGIAVIHVGVKG